MLVPDGVLRHATRDPDRVALVRGDHATTYGALGARITHVAAGLRARADAASDPHGRVVGLLIEDPDDFLAAFLGVVHGGAVAAPLSRAWPAATLRAAIARCGPAAVLSDARARARTSALPGAAPLAAIEHAGAAAASGARHARRRSRGSPDSPFYVGFTSGSTGQPRGVVRAHAAWVTSFDAMTRTFGVDRGARVLVPGSLFFSFSLIAALHALDVGGTVVLPARGGARGLATAMRGGAATLYALPSLLHETLALARRRGESFMDVERIICAGERLPAETRALVNAVCPAAELYEYYGASELGFVTVLDPADVDAHPHSVGRPFPGSDVAVLDDAGHPVADDEPGLLCARTPYGGTHYLDADGRIPLDEALDHHGWRTVGDLARRDAEGYITLVGRRDRMVVIRGENVYPEETERVLASQPGVERAVAIAQPAERPTHLVAFVQPAPGAVLDPAAMLRACRRALSRRQAPRRIEIREQLPLTATGKVDPRAVAQLLAAPTPAGG